MVRDGLDVRRQRVAGAGVDRSLVDPRKRHGRSLQHVVERCGVCFIGQKQTKLSEGL